MLKRGLLFGGAAAIALAISAPPSASAGAPEDLAAKVEALEAQLEELKAALEAQKIATDDGIERLEARTESVARASGVEPVDGFMVGDTNVKLGAIIDLDVNVTDTSDGEIAGGSVARDFYIPGATPVGGIGESTPDTDLTVEASRLFVKTQTKRGGHDIGSHLEVDFLISSQGNERVSNSFAPRLRHAFVTIDNWMVGQNWSTFQNTSTIPESASFLALSDGMVFVRQPQIRYTRGPWQFAIENPNTTEIGSPGRSADDGLAPDLVAKYTAKGDFGNVSFGALGRYLSREVADGAGGFNEETALGWGLSVAGDVNLTPTTGVKFSLTGGEGLGRYIGLNAVNGARFDAGGDLEAIESVGGLLALRTKIGPKSRITAGYSGLFADSEIGETESVQSLLGVFAHDIAPKTSIAGEIMLGRRTVDSLGGVDDEGDISRATISIKHAY